MKFSEYVNNLIEESLPQELTKRFEKENRKLEKKGKPIMTAEEFTEKIRKENEKYYKNVKLSNMAVVVFILGIIIVMPTMELANGGTVADALIFGVILAVIEIPLAKLFISWDSGCDARRKIMEECDEQEITIIEYAKRIEMGKSMGKNDEHMIEEV